MNTEKNMIDIGNGETIEISPELLLDSLDPVNTMVSCHVKLLETVRDLIKKYISAGMSMDDAAAVALEFQKRAGKKANEMVHFLDEAKSDEGNKDESTKSDK